MPIASKSRLTLLMVVGVSLMLAGGVCAQGNSQGKGEASAPGQLKKQQGATAGPSNDSPSPSGKHQWGPWGGGCACDGVA